MSSIFSFGRKSGKATRDRADRSQAPEEISGQRGQSSSGSPRPTSNEGGGDREIGKGREAQMEALRETVANSMRQTLEFLLEYINTAVAAAQEGGNAARAVDRVGGLVADLTPPIRVQPSEQGEERLGKAQTQQLNAALAAAFAQETSGRGLVSAFSTCESPTSPFTIVTESHAVAVPLFAPRPDQFGKAELTSGAPLNGPSDGPLGNEFNPGHTDEPSGNGLQPTCPSPFSALGLPSPPSGEGFPMHQQNRQPQVSGFRSPVIPAALPHSVPPTPGDSLPPPAPNWPAMANSANVTASPQPMSRPIVKGWEASTPQSGSDRAGVHPEELSSPFPLPPAWQSPFHSPILPPSATKTTPGSIVPPPLPPQAGGPLSPPPAPPTSGNFAEWLRSSRETDENTPLRL